jgi:hypothetical protein
LSSRENGPAAFQNHSHNVTLNKKKSQSETDRNSLWKNAGVFLCKSPPQYERNLSCSGESAATILIFFRLKNITPAPFSRRESHER